MVVGGNVDQVFEAEVSEGFVEILATGVALFVDDNVRITNDFIILWILFGQNFLEFVFVDVLFENIFLFLLLCFRFFHFQTGLALDFWCQHLPQLVEY